MYIALHFPLSAPCSHLLSKMRLACDVEEKGSRRMGAQVINTTVTRPNVGCVTLQPNGIRYPLRLAHAPPVSETTPLPPSSNYVLFALASVSSPCLPHIRPSCHLQGLLSKLTSHHPSSFFLPSPLLLLLFFSHTPHAINALPFFFYLASGEGRLLTGVRLV